MTAGCTAMLHPPAIRHRVARAPARNPGPVGRVSAKGAPVKPTAIPAVTTPLSVLLATFHLADDILFRMSGPGLENLFGFLILAVWLHGSLVLAGRRAGHVIGLLGALFGLALSVIHMQGAGGMLGGDIGRSDHAYFFVWTLVALGTTSVFAAGVEVRLLWNGRRREKETAA